MSFRRNRSKILGQDTGGGPNKAGLVSPIGRKGVLMRHVRPRTSRPIDNMFDGTFDGTFDGSTGSAFAGPHTPEQITAYGTLIRALNKQMMVGYCNNWVTQFNIIINNVADTTDGEGTVTKAGQSITAALAAAKQAETDDAKMIQNICTIILSVFPPKDEHGADIVYDKDTYVEFLNMNPTEMQQQITEFFKAMPKLHGTVEKDHKLLAFRMYIDQMGMGPGPLQTLYFGSILGFPTPTEMFRMDDGTVEEMVANYPNSEYPGKFVSDSTLTAIFTEIDSTQLMKQLQGSSVVLNSFGIELYQELITLIDTQTSNDDFLYKHMYHTNPYCMRFTSMSSRRVAVLTSRKNN